MPPFTSLFRQVVSGKKTCALGAKETRKKAIACHYVANADGVLQGHAVFLFVIIIFVFVLAIETLQGFIRSDTTKKKSRKKKTQDNKKELDGTEMNEKGKRKTATKNYCHGFYKIHTA